MSRRMKQAVFLCLAVSALSVSCSKADTPPQPQPQEDPRCLIYQTGECPPEHPTPMIQSTTTAVPVQDPVQLPPLPVITVPPQVVQETIHDDGCWIDLARSVGWPEETLANLARIIHRESRCNPSAFADRPSTLDNSRGLLQINAWGTLADNIRAKCGMEPDSLFDPEQNLRCGLVYWQQMGWRPWGGA